MSRVDFPPRRPQGHPLWRLGFRPFFLAAGLYAVLSVALWTAIYATGWRPPLAGLSPSLWHAHEMVFGYALAVIAGFLLSAVVNWTGQPTLTGRPLAALLASWVVARLLMIFGGGELFAWAVAADLLFVTGLLVAIARPVVRVRQWRQLPVLLIPAGLALAHLLVPLLDGPRRGIYAGLLLVVLLIMLVGRRVIPFFIERGLGGDTRIETPMAVDVAAIGLFLVYGAAELVAPVSPWTAWLASLAAMAHAVRLALWHRTGIWRIPMVWVLWLGYAWLVAGLALRATSLLATINPFLSIHALTYGGVGLLTLGMMSRVTLGHTGRDVLQPPAGTGALFVLLAAGAVVRVLLPLLLPEYYRVLVMVSQGLWMAAFAGFVALYAPIQLAARVDGLDG